MAAGATAPAAGDPDNRLRGFRLRPNAPAAALGTGRDI